jgi:hypothetical protein
VLFTTANHLIAILNQVTFMISLRIVATGIVLSAVGSGAVWAQSSGSQYTDLSQYLIAPGGQVFPTENANGNARASNGGNTAFVSQVGDINAVSVDVQGSLNTTSQTQVGSGNESNFIAIGNQNAFQNTQIGTHNAANVSVVGNSNGLSNTQIGTNLSYSLTQIGNGRTVSVTQMGVGK